VGFIVFVTGYCKMAPDCIQFDSANCRRLLVQYHRVASHWPVDERNSLAHHRSIHENTGVKRPEWNFENLKDKNRLAAFQEVIENHYRYYQYYANTLTAILMAFAAYLVVTPKEKWPSLMIWLLFGFVVLALFFGSRDALKKFYARSSAVLH